MNPKTVEDEAVAASREEKEQEEEEGEATVASSHEEKEKEKEEDEGEATVGNDREDDNGGGPSISASKELSPSYGSPSTPHIDEKGVHHSSAVFVFWAYFVAFVCLVTLAFVLFSTILPFDQQAEFFAMPDDVRQHFIKGKLIKIELGEDQQPIRVFVREEGPSRGESVVLVHGLGSSSFLYREVIPHLVSHGLHVLAIDFPGAGLSDKPARGRWGMFSKLREIYEEISDKGLLWRFEQLFETGALPTYGESRATTDRRGLNYRAEELGQSLAQVLDLLVMSPVHIVLHDTGVEAGSAWATRNPSRVRSITLLDTLPGRPSFPGRLLGVPGVGFLMTWSSFVHWVLLRLCCARNLSTNEAEAHGFLLGTNDGRKATLETWNMINTSFDLVASMEGLGQVPLQVLWSSSSGKDWQEHGDMFAARLPRALFLSHHGSRWPQEDAAAEIAEAIQRFISSLPPTEHFSSDEPVPQHIQEMFDQMARGVDGGHHDHHHHGQDHEHGHPTHDHGHGHHSHDHGHGHHSHDHGPAYMDGMGHGGWVL